MAERAEATHHPLSEYLMDRYVLLRYKELYSKEGTQGKRKTKGRSHCMMQMSSC
jgi:hypothetical protein